MKRVLMNKNISIALGIIVLVASSFLVGCERNTEAEGPSLNDLYGDFTVLQDFEANQETVDFSSQESMHFKARFSTITSWRITISSDNSDAIKIIEGRSNILDEETASWDGTTTLFPTFGIGSCTAELWTEADSSIQTTKVTVSGLRTPSGVVVADFENGINPDWTVFAQSGANMTFTIGNTEVVPQGDNYFDMGGAVDWDYLIGLVDFPGTSVGPNGFELPSNPDNIYFNVALYRPEGITNGIVLFRFSEDENGDGTFTEANEDQYAVELTDLEEGWQIVSVKYSDLVALENGQPTTPKGNNQHNPDKLNMVSCLFLANPATGYSQTLMDYMIFTTDGPLKL